MSPRVAERWHRPACHWLMAVALGHVAGGILLYANTPENLVDAYLHALFQSLQSVDTDPVPTRLLLQLFGATVASWGLLMCYLVRRIRIARDRAAMEMLLLATLTWFLLDTLLSISQGISLHVIINGVAVLLIIVPGLIIRPALGWNTH